jgi:hypothetical protein
VELARIREAIYDVLGQYHPMTVRQVFYQVASHRCIIEKTENEYKNTVGRLLLAMRKEGEVPWDWVSDNTRWMRKRRTFSSLEQALANTAQTYRRDLWDNQDVYVEVWCEKDALAGALDRLNDVRLDRLPRMADFALLGVAAEQALGWPRGAFLAAYGDNRQTAHSIVLESSPIVPPLLDLAATGEWEGSATDLLAELARRAGESVTRRQDWPKKAQGLSGKLWRLAPSLRTVGVTITFGWGVKSRIIRLSGRPTNANNANNDPAPSCSYEEQYEEQDVRTPFDD